MMLRGCYHVLCSFSLLCLLSFLGVHRSEGLPLVRQGDALNKLVFDKRVAGGNGRNNFPTFAAEFVSENTAHGDYGLKADDKIEKLPGQPEGVDFDQYGGYVTVDRGAGRALFYYFVEAAGDEKASKPLLLWLNGGPGCSSFLGALEELGPFRVMSDGKTLYRNPYAWNAVANVLFLETPAGVGFSYSNTTTDYNYNGDPRTAADSYVFLLNWMERFPEYKGREFYLAGESYAGHYVPQLAAVILADKNQTSINLKGITIGNPSIDDAAETKGLFDYWWTHALISKATRDTILRSCDFTGNTTKQSAECTPALQEFLEVLSNGVDFYNIYAPVCFSASPTAVPKTPSIDEYDPCTDVYVTAYLNDLEVQKALHANTGLNYTWVGCRTPSIWLDAPTTMVPVIQQILSSGLRVWVFSGDVDGRIPVTATMYSLKLLKLATKSRWRPWTVNNMVGGFTEVYEGNLTFATVRGAGHSVPSYQPARSLVYIKAFLQGMELPRNATI